MFRHVGPLFLTASDVPPSFVTKTPIDQKRGNNGTHNRMQSSVGINNDQCAASSSSETSNHQPVAHSVTTEPEQSTKSLQPMEIHNHDAACDDVSINSGTVL